MPRHKTKRQARAAKDEQPVPQGPLHIIVSTAKQRVTAYANGYPRRARADLYRNAGPSDAHGSFHSHFEEPVARLQYLTAGRDALYAAHHLVGDRFACRQAARLSGVARLHPPARTFRSPALGPKQVRRAGDYCPR